MANWTAKQVMGKDMKRRGFKFVGNTICYTFMQAVGMLNEHLIECFRHEQLAMEIGDE
jgi:DNA-3-methyladenine glycosylase I